ncbi:unnamed protein product [Zymoseptoria tritici ST99CH_1A5]|uniref:F-box domain-containing protein n=2 Tax=Zymoseptoria tritici TaxID=1047171 RepID=A0A1X7S299_ZYMT9|nr:unnamed protein product [Zymoseptoria tritici ST99CH_3D7]SMY27455.1 unnamed protein product [Zymoseptoria tritici ST99CH_1A5]
MATHPLENIQDVRQVSPMPNSANSAIDEARLSPRQDTATSSCKPPSRHLAVCQASAAGIAAQKVFDMCELLEQILSYSEPVDLLRAMSTQRCWKDTIEGSLKLKRLLGLAPTGKAFYSPFFHQSADYRGTVTRRFMKEDQHILTCRMFYPGDVEATRNPMATSDQFCTISVEVIHCPTRTIPSIWTRSFGSRARDMAICNPPINVLWPTAECKDRSHELEDYGCFNEDFEPIYSTSERGFTVGELADAVVSLAGSKHLDCKAWRQFYWHGAAQVEVGDPLVASWIEQRARQQLEIDCANSQTGSYSDIGEEDDVEPWSEQSSEHNTESEHTDDDEHYEDGLGRDGADWDETKEERAQLVWQTINAGKGARTDINEQDFDRLKALIESTYSNATLTRRTPHDEEELDWSVSPPAKSRGEAEDAEVDRDEAEPAA